MGAFGTWLLSLCAAGILAGICTALAPEDGRKTVKLAGGLLLLLAALLPFRQIANFSPLAQLDQLNRQLSTAIAAEENLDIEEMRVLVEDQCEAWIAAKAAEIGVFCTASITARIDESGVLRAYAAQIVYQAPMPSGEQLAAVKGLLAEGLGIPESRQQHR